MSASTTGGTVNVQNGGSEPDWQQLKQTVIAYAAAHGISMVLDTKTNALIHAPITLLPTVIDRQSYERVVALSPYWHEVISNITRDANDTFLIQHLLSAGKVDSFIQSFLDILEQVRTFRSQPNAWKEQPIQLGVYRSDYMVHVDDQGKCSPQQIELNTIAASFAGLSTRVSEMHKFMLQRECGWTEEQITKCLPENKAIQGIAKAFHVAFEAYKKQPYPSSSPATPNHSSQLVVVMVVQPGESNAIDQRILEYTLWSLYKIPLIRRSLAEIQSQHSFDSHGQLLLDQGKYTAAIVYFRAGYTPRDYISEKETQAVFTIEKSRAIKCPTVAQHLAGSKKIQEVLSNDILLGLTGEDKAKEKLKGEKLKEVFTELYDLDQDDEKTLAIIQAAISNPSAYVLKPQREGGGNNLWNDEMVAALKRMTRLERAAYILMKKISPRPTRAALLRKGELQVVECISELGIYSVCVSEISPSDRQVTFLHQDCCGHLLRTKAVGVDEGGVAAGFSCLSSVRFE